MTEIWAVAHPKHPTTYRDTKTEALALVDAWTTETGAAICWPMTVEDEPCLCWTDFTCLAREHDTTDQLEETA